MRRSKLALVAVYAGLILMTANLVADHLGLKYLHPGNKRWYASAYALEGLERPVDLVILGTSMGRFGLNATRIAEVLAEQGHGDLEAFNLSQPAAGPVRNNALLRDLISSRGCPSIVIVEVSHFGLRPEGTWWRLLGDYATIRDIPILAEDLAELEHADGFLSSSTRGFERFYDYLLRRPSSETIEREIERRGSQYKDRPWKFPRLERDLELAPPTEGPLNRGNSNRSTFELRAAPERGLEAIADAVRGCSAQLFLLRLPTASALSRKNTGAIDEEFRSELETFATRRDAVFLDYNMIDLGLVTGEFRDWTHLNYDGAEKLSDHLARQVISPRLEDRRANDDLRPTS